MVYQQKRHFAKKGRESHSDLMKGESLYAVDTIKNYHNFGRHKAICKYKLLPQDLSFEHIFLDSNSNLSILVSIQGIWFLW